MKIKKYIIIILTIIFTFGVIYSCYNIISWKISVDKNNKIQNKINNYIKITEEGLSTETKYNIDFQELKKQNPDTMAYLRVYGTNIDNIVVKANDNSYYLNHNFNKEYSIAGWIFIDYHNILDESDKNIVIYGHDMQDDSMFGTLKNILEKTWYENKENHKIIFVTENKEYIYQVFSTYSILAEDYYIKTSFNDDNEYTTFINKLKNRSIYNYNIDVTKEDKILTLSSCIGDGKKRVVLHAKLVNE